MAFDGIVTKAIISELSILNGARIDKVFQPSKNDIILGLYKDGKNYALNICINSQNCRINLTTKTKPNPQVAPNFCMVLRKNLIGLKLKNIVSIDLERLVIIDFEGFDELDDIISKKLIIELMGKHSNVILLDDTNIIIDSLRHIKETDENFRDILPHSKYSFPNSNKYNLLEVSNFSNFENIINKDNNFNVYENYSINDLSSKISNTFNGISKSTISSIINFYNINTVNRDSLNLIFNYLNNLITNLNDNSINTLDFKEIKNSDGIIKDYFLTFTENEFNNENNNNNFKLNFFIDDFYYNKESNESFKNAKNTLSNLILSTLKKYNKRLYNINEKLTECSDMEKYRIYGELITANLYRIPNKNIEYIELENYYDNNKKITIKLDNKYSPSVNAKRFFKKYSKLKNALEIVSKQKSETLNDVNYIESVIFELENASTLDDISNIFEEISESDIFNIKTIESKNSKKNSKIKKSKFTKNKEVSFNPIKYNVDGYTVLVGRNNKENDYLTLKYANKNDIWFHTKDFHGSHTILRIDNNKNYPNTDLLEKVAKLAATHSKAKNSSNVPVDYCEVKYVKKPSGAKPGMVIYTNYKTINVTP